jgi:hypothetical protein
MVYLVRSASCHEFVIILGQELVFDEFDRPVSYHPLSFSAEGK